MTESGEHIPLILSRSGTNTLLLDMVYFIINFKSLLAFMSDDRAGRRTG